LQSQTRSLFEKAAPCSSEVFSASRLCVYLFEEESAARVRDLRCCIYTHAEPNSLSLQDITLGAISHLFLAQPPFDMGPRALFPFALRGSCIYRAAVVSMATPRDKLGCPFRTELSARSVVPRERKRTCAAHVQGLGRVICKSEREMRSRTHSPKNRTLSLHSAAASLFRFCILTFCYWHRT
jgi:hypothetical protein